MLTLLLLLHTLAFSFKLLDCEHPTASSPHHSDQFLLCFVCYPCFISCHPFDCPVHPDALHPPSPLLMWSTQLLCYSCPTSYYPSATLAAGRWPDAARLVGSQRICRLVEPSGGRTAAAAGAGKGSMAGLPSRLLWSRQPRPGKRPVSPRRRPALHTKPVKTTRESRLTRQERRRQVQHTVCR